MKKIKLSYVIILLSTVLFSCGNSNINSSYISEDDYSLESTNPSIFSSENHTSLEMESMNSSQTISEEDNNIYNIVPDMVWALENKDTATSTFIMGDSVNSFQFKSVDISKMKYIEFDLYLPTINGFDNISKDSQFEITSSGKCDIEEFSWYAGDKSILDGINILQGWNHVKVELPEMKEVNKSSVNFIRWYWVNPKSTIPGCKVANLRFTTDGSIDPSLIGKVASSGFVVETFYETKDVVIATFDITKAPYNADNTGKSDVTGVINKALKDVYENGGGTLWLPKGKYLISDTIEIPTYCTLRGDYQDPDVGTDYGTIILADVKESSISNEALFLLGGSAGVNGLTIYYVNQTLNDIKEYPFTFYTNGLGSSYMLSSITNCTIINGYQGIGACVLESNAHEQLTIENVKGTFLRTACEIYNQADVGTLKSVVVNKKYWLESPLNKEKLDVNVLSNYLKNNTIGLILGDLEWTEFVDLNVDECKYGIQIVKGHRIEFAGSIFDANITNCDIGLKIDSIDDRWGMILTNSYIQGKSYSIENNTNGVVKMTNVDLIGYTKGSNIISKNSEKAKNININYSYTYIKPNNNLYVYEGLVDGKQDVSADIQHLLNEAESTGGVVYLPGGYYRLDNSINVPKNVELRGSAGSPTRDATGSSEGTVILAYYGDDSTFGENSKALITLSVGAGVNGIRILYPENGPMDSSLTTSYAIRGLGKNVYIVNTSISSSSYGVDFSSCDNYYIKKLVTCCYFNAMKLGGNNGVVEGCLQNGSVYTRMSSNLASFCKNMINESDIHLKLYDVITRIDCHYIKIEEGSNQLIYNTFAYGTYNFIDNNGGMNVNIINVGSDNIGGYQFYQESGSMSVLGSMRYNGSSYYLKSGSLNLYARLTINDKNEDNLETFK